MKKSEALKKISAWILFLFLAAMAFIIFQTIFNAIPAAYSYATDDNIYQSATGPGPVNKDTVDREQEAVEKLISMMDERAAAGECCSLKIKFFDEYNNSGTCELFPCRGEIILYHEKHGSYLIDFRDREALSPFDCYVVEWSVINLENREDEIKEKWKCQ